MKYQIVSGFKSQLTYSGGGNLYGGLIFETQFQGAVLPKRLDFLP